MLIDRGLVAVADSVLDAPEQTIRLTSERLVLQSRVRGINDCLYLVRLVLDDSVVPPLVITAYRTTRLEKYWRTD